MEERKEQDRRKRCEVKKPQKVFYLCDGEVEGCKKHSCYKNNGRCNYTSDIMHAKNFHKIDAPYSVFYENEAVSGETDTAIEEVV